MSALKPISIQFTDNCDPTTAADIAKLFELDEHAIEKRCTPAKFKDTGEITIVFDCCANNPTIEHMRQTTSIAVDHLEATGQDGLVRLFFTATNYEKKPFLNPTVSRYPVFA